MKIKLFSLCLLLMITSVAIYWPTPLGKTSKTAKLWQYFNKIDGYKTLRKIQMEESHVNMLKVDDYVFVDYSGSQGSINLFIGYYYTSDKAYASHSPLICYPSQGWKITKNPTRHAMMVGPYKVNYEEIITTLGRKKELVLYWYQSYDRTNTKTYQNKIDMGYNKIMNNTEEHAFIRVSIPFFNSTYEQVKSTVIKFIEGFYPTFLEFITAENQE